MRIGRTRDIESDCCEENGNSRLKFVSLISFRRTWPIVSVYSHFIQNIHWLWLWLLCIIHLSAFWKSIPIHSFIHSRSLGPYFRHVLKETHPYLTISTSKRRTLSLLKHPLNIFNNSRMKNPQYYWLKYWALLC